LVLGCAASRLIITKISGAVLTLTGHLEQLMAKYQTKNAETFIFKSSAFYFIHSMF